MWKTSFLPDCLSFAVSFSLSVPDFLKTDREKHVSAGLKSWKESGDLLVPLIWSGKFLPVLRSILRKNSL